MIFGAGREKYHIHYMNIVTAVTGLVALAIIYNYVETGGQELVRVKSTVDGQSYLVLNKTDKVAAADMLAKLRAKMRTFISRLDKTDPAVSRLNRKFSAVLVENGPTSKYTSYTVNKGHKMFMCVRERDAGDALVDENTLFFVALHELAHVMSVSVGHTGEFWDHFKYLLQRAKDEGFYQYQDYSKEPQKYCGMTIAKNPL